MFELAALPLPLLPISSAGIALDIAGNAGGPGEMAQGGRFEAMLALQSAQPLTPHPASLPAPVIPATVPASGKILPETAMPVAGIAAIATLAAAPDSDVKNDAEDDRPDVAKAEAALPDQALIAAIFAAPQRLAQGPKTEQPEAPATRIAPSTITPAQMRAPEPVRPAVSSQPNPVAIAATVAAAKAAVIELAPSYPRDIPAESPEIPESPAPAQPAAPALASSHVGRPQVPARASTGADAPAAEKLSVPVAIAAAVADRDEAPPPSRNTAEDLVAPVLHRVAEAASPQDAAPAARAEHRPERIDFAALVDTLNRAREEAEPNTVRVSVAHADFGRVSMRFEQDGSGMSIAMSSADPGFVRAVTASSEAAAASTSSDTPRENNPQTQARSGSNASGEGSRQQQHSPHAETSDRPAAQLRDTLRRDEDSATPGGIFA